MYLLGQYVPEPPALVRSLSEMAETTAKEFDVDSLRAAFRSKQDYERHANAVIAGVGRLREDARHRSLDLESALREIKTYEREARKAADEWKRYAEAGDDFIQKATRFRMPPEHVEFAQEFRDGSASLRDIQTRVWREYLECRQELESLRKARLAEYLNEWDSLLDSISSDFRPIIDSAWRAAKGLRLWAPEASLTGEGFLMVWDRGAHHVQVEVYPNGTFDWFYRDRSEEGYKFGEGLPLGEFRVSIAPLAKVLRRG